VLTLEAWSKFNGRKQVQIFRRTIPNELVDKAIAAVLLFSIVGAIALTCLLVADEVSVQPDSERGDFLGSTFEVISALGTVGLSTGATMKLDAVGRWIIIVLMFVGRLGPISAAVALSHGERDAHLSYPKEEVLVG
jgi:trk system potassium uptake protein TrkH